MAEPSVWLARRRAGGALRAAGRTVVGIGLLALAVIKMVSAPAGDSLIGNGSVYYAAVLTEMICGGLILRGFAVVGLVGALLLFDAGAVLALLYEGPCGCGGNLFTLSRQQHLVSACACGVIASTLLWGELGGDREAGPEGRGDSSS